MSHICGAIFFIPSTLASGFPVFFVISYMARFSEKMYLMQNLCFDFLYNICLRVFSVQEKINEMSYIHLDHEVKCLLFHSVLIKIDFGWQVFVKVLNTRFSWKFV
jgi:hypothetical protein